MSKIAKQMISSFLLLLLPLCFLSACSYNSTLAFKGVSNPVKSTDVSAEKDPVSATVSIDPASETILKSYIVSYYAKLISNHHVGNEWSYGMKYGNNQIFSGDVVTATVTKNQSPKFIIFASEYDESKPDFANSDFTFEDIPIGEATNITKQVTVTENAGRYRGKAATWEFYIEIERIS